MTRTMSFRITRPVNPILGPFAVFGIIWGVAAMIGLPLLQVFVPLSGGARRTVLLVTVLVAALAGSGYSVLYARRQRTKLSVLDTGVYYFFWPILFFSILAFGFYLSRE
jgi:tryptophan-rich sensory protein